MADETHPEDGDPPVPEASARFVVTINGAAARCELVRGVEGVRDAFLRAVWRGPRDAVPDDLAALAMALDAPAAWAEHGHGDGRPFWHWWTALADGSFSAQRLTVPLPEMARERAEREARTAALQQAASALAECAADLRRAAGARLSGPLHLTAE